MHVCHLCDTSVDGDYFRNISAGLVKNGVSVTLAELGTSTRPDWLDETTDVGYINLRADSKLEYLRAAADLARYCEKENVDILHTHLFYSGIVGVLTKRKFGKVTTALMRHHTGVVRMLGSRLHIIADKWMAEKADRVMTVSDAARRYMTEVDGIRRNDIEVVYLGFDFEKMQRNASARDTVRQEFGFSDNDMVIGYVGNFAEGKGHRQLVEAFGLIQNDLPNAKLFLVGKGMLPDVEAAATALADDSVTFAGWRSDVSACLNAMDIFVQPSLSEAFSQVLIEAMGVGLPVIATDVGGVREVIESAVNGVIIPPNDPLAIAREVIALASDPKKMKSIAEAGTSSVVERFTAEKMVERHVELYKSWAARS